MVLFFFSLFLMISGLVYFFEYNFFVINSSCFVMTFLVDWMSMLFMSFVLFISGMVIYYSLDYMAGDLNLNRFILLVVMFVLSMMFLIISPNLISILLGWDGLGLVSYCLVIYYQNMKSYNAGMLTALMNRVGDAALLISIAWMVNYGSWNFIFYLVEMGDDFFMSMVSLMVVLAAMTKSAQIPFSSWLPAAMAAPTPVSSLVHSSTLVTAGVYLLIRFNFAFSSGVMMFLMFIGTMTMFMSGLGASFEFDLKKVIALSTLSQLGLMVAVLALGGYKLAFFHLLTHALFKALLFMCAGNVIHSLNNCQDIRFMGSLSLNMPLTCVYFNVSNLSLCGLPFLSGFYSKDLILEFMSMGYINGFIYLVFYVSVGLTVCYSFRLVYYSFIGDFNVMSLGGVYDSSRVILYSMGGLILFVVCMGSMLSWLIFDYPYVVVLPFYMKCMALLFILLGIWLGLEVSFLGLNYLNYSLCNLSLSSFLGNMWNMPIVSTLGVGYYFLIGGSVVYKGFDQGWFEYYGTQGINSSLIGLSKGAQLLMFNNIKLFFSLVVFWLMFLCFV
uniref:NADH-ubiquinone oxidoreductase chain 5 n=1 Tax=Scaphidema metallicum TaxID=1586539 RepID=A0A343C3N8_9CUCU|nr:NADH dehydrogenase subunit 5 [Scaphidema metallicum]